MLVIKQFGPVTYAMGALQEILAGTGIAAKVRALPNDVAGTYLEMGADGLWTGASVGYLTKAQADALKAAQGVRATLKVGVPGQVDGGPVTWRGAGVGWVGVDRRSLVVPLRPCQIASLDVPGANVGSGNTIFLRRPAPGKFCGFKIVFENPSPTVAMQIAKCRVSTCNAAGANHGAAGSYGTVVNVTFSGTATATLPLAARWSDNSGNCDNFGRLISDYVDLPYVGRVDGGTDPLIDIRIMPGANGFFTASHAPSSVPLAGIRKEYFDCYDGGNKIDDWSNELWNQMGNIGKFLTGVWVIWYLIDGTTTIACLGDSIMQGATTAGTRSSALALACSDIGYECNWFAHGGKPSTSWSAELAAFNGNQFFDTRLVVIPVATPNDGTTANMLYAWRRFIENFELVTKAGKIPVVIGPHPSGSTPDLIARLNSLRIAWFNPCNYIAANPSNPTSFAAGASDDTVHPNDYGASLYRTPLANFIKAIGAAQR